MAFRLYNGNDLGGMSDTLCQRLRESQPVDPLTKSLVIVQSTGMARWLTQRIAEVNGIAANIEFIFPGKFLYLYLFAPLKEIDPEIDIAEVSGDELPFTPEVTTWRIIALLDQFPDHPAFVPLNTYIRDSELKRYQIAARIAALFDRYMTYRPHILATWEANPAADGWQSHLWHSLTQGRISHFSGLFQRFMWHAKNGTLTSVFEPLRSRGTISFFGFSALPPAHLALIHKAAEWVDIDFHWFNPSEALWDTPPPPRTSYFVPDSDDLPMPDGHPLLGTLGRRGREFFRFVLDRTDGQTHAELFRDDFPESLLGQLQSDIQANAVPEMSPMRPDDSIEIHNAFSPQREIEALHDYLLDAFRRDSALLPKDVIVYTPDIETYAPYIEAVFGTVTGDTPRIPYTVTDKSLGAEHPEFRFFLTILNLSHGRFSASDVIGLLNLPSIRQKFGIDESEIATLEKLMRSANLTWGIDETSRIRSCGVGYRENSWRFALERALFGIMFADPVNAPLLQLDGRDIAPLPDAADHATLVGRFAEFCETLFRLTENADSVRSGNGWTVHLRNVLNALFEREGTGPGFAAVSRTLSQLERLLAQTGFTDTSIHEEVIIAWLSEHAEGRRSDERFCRGMVTFCRFQPMRNIPADIVCMVGLNDGAFPRQEQTLAFDLMLKARYLADGSLRDDDRFAFLEALLSARKRIALFYTGQSDRDKKSIPPSVLLSALIDTLTQTFGEDTVSAITTRHPLHPFGREYFMSPSPGLRNYRPEWFRAASHLASASAENAVTAWPALPLDEPLTQLSLRALTAFLKRPSGTFYERRLGIDLDLPVSDDSTDETDPVDALRAHQIATRFMASKDAARLRSVMDAEGLLPLGPLGKTAIHTALEQTQWLREVIGDTPLETLDFELDINGCILTGTLEGIAPDRLVIPITGSLRMKYELEGFIRHTVLSALREPNTELPGTTVIYACNTKLKNEEHTFAPLSPEVARKYLATLLDLYRLGQSNPLPFDPEISAAILESHAAFTKAWTSDYADPNFLRAFGTNGKPPSEESIEYQKMTETAAAIIGPLKEASQ